MNTKQTPQQAGGPPRKDVLEALTQIFTTTHSSRGETNRKPDKGDKNRRFTLHRRRAKPAQ